jgi:hypothetical protein
MSAVKRMGFRRDLLIWVVLLGSACVGQLAPLLACCGYHESFNYNEGWNVFYANLVARGGPVDAPPPEFMLADYTSFSFHVAKLSPFFGRPLNDGRILAVWWLSKDSCVRWNVTQVGNHDFV